jgi:hypothetical protein
MSSSSSKNFPTRGALALVIDNEGEVEHEDRREGREQVQDGARLQEKIGTAIGNFDFLSQEILTGLFGLNGWPSIPAECVGEVLEMSPQQVRREEADILRALIGYGRKAKKTLSHEQ